MQVPQIHVRPRGQTGPESVTVHRALGVVIVDTTVYFVGLVDRSAEGEYVLAPIEY